MPLVSELTVEGHRTDPWGESTHSMWIQDMCHHVNIYWAGRLWLEWRPIIGNEASCTNCTAKCTFVHHMRRVLINRSQIYVEGFAFVQRGVHPSAEYFYSEFVLCNPSRVASEADMKYKHMVKHRSLLTQSSGGTSWKSVLKGWLSMIFVLRVKRDSLTGLLHRWHWQLKSGWYEMWDQAWDWKVLKWNSKGIFQNGAGKQAACSQDCRCLWKSFSSCWKTIHDSIKVGLKGFRSWLKLNITFIGWPKFWVNFGFV